MMAPSPAHNHSRQVKAILIVLAYIAIVLTAAIIATYIQPGGPF